MIGAAGFRSLLTDGVPLLDVRAPVEFARGSVPGAVNLPLLDDAEREQVGITYKHDGHAAAVARGERLVSGSVREARIAGWQAFARQHAQAALFCWRGGQRSQIVQAWLSANGTHVPRIGGGFKALRTFLTDSIEQLAGTLPLIVIGGRTGTGKTRLLHEFDTCIDLEGRANHRGSSFGRNPTPQPTPINFEHALAVDLLRVAAAACVPVEDEGRTIGRLGVPVPLHRAMQRAPLVIVAADLETRIDVIQRDYIDDMLAAFVRSHGDNAFPAFRQHLTAALDRIRKRLGGLRHAQLARQLGDALDAQARGAGSDVHRTWIGAVMSAYYDPMYDHQLAAKDHRVLFQGSFAACRQWLAAYMQAAPRGPGNVVSPPPPAPGWPRSAADRAP